MVTLIPNVPCKYQGLIKDEQIQFILLHKLLNNKEYADYYLSNSFKYVILDNSAFELTEAIDGDTLMKYARSYDVDEVIIPDNYGNKDNTLELMNEFLDVYKYTEINLMVVPQGKTQSERLECLNTMLKEPKIHCIGLNKLWERDFYFLQQVVDTINFNNKKVHFLGTRNLLDWGLIKELAGVRSADSRILSKMVTGVDDIWEEELDNQQINILENLINEVNGKEWNKPNQI